MFSHLRPKLSQQDWKSAEIMGFVAHVECCAAAASAFPAADLLNSLKLLKTSGGLMLFINC